MITLRNLLLLDLQLGKLLFQRLHEIYTRVNWLAHTVLVREGFLEGDLVLVQETLLFHDPLVKSHQEAVQLALQLGKVLPDRRI